jgi:hypothetical protein
MEEVQRRVRRAGKLKVGLKLGTLSLHVIVALMGLAQKRHL